MLCDSSRLWTTPFSTAAHENQKRQLLAKTKKTAARQGSKRSGRAHALHQSRYAVVQNSAKISLGKCTSPLDKNAQLPNLVIVTMLEANLELAWEIRFRPEAQFCRSWRKSALPSRPSGLNNYCVSRTHIWGPGRFGRRGPFLSLKRNGRRTANAPLGRRAHTACELASARADRSTLVSLQAGSTRRVHAVASIVASCASR